jgi:outer membrane receptor for ferrienterochelin and colicins
MNYKTPTACRLLLAACLLLLLAGSAPAQLATPQQGKEEKELEDLLSIVQQETEVATKTKMNSDYVPGIVTVLEGDELEALGVATAGEALGLVPGMFATSDRLGNRSVTVRGLDFPFNAGNILILLNGIPVSRPDAGITGAALLLPVEQIERIEVIRGPGSVVYGDFAFMGLVNIITRKEGTRIFGRFDAPHRSVSIGGRDAWKGVSANVSNFTSSNFAAPVQAHGADDDRVFGIAAFERGGFSVAVQSAHRNYDGHAGGALFDENSWVVEGKYSRALKPSLQATARVTYLENDLDDFTSQFTGHLVKLGLDAVWSGMRRNAWLAGVDYTSSIIEDATHRAPPPPGQPAGPPVLLAHDADRQISGIYLQDQIDLHPRLTLTVGGRYDAYSDLDSRFTPRVAIAWRISGAHILKAQYAEGFRPPTFFELYQPPPPRSVPRYYFETNATTELNYVYRAAGRVARATVFHEVLTNMIRPGGFITDPNASANGAEAEWSQQIAAPLKFDVNVSYVATVDPRAVGPGAPRLPNTVSPRWLGNVSLFYRPIRGLVVGSRLSHTGDRPAGRNIDQLDFTISKEELFLPGLSVRAGVKNALDADVNYLTLRPNGVVDTSTFPGRSVWLQVSWKR